MPLKSNIPALRAALAPAAARGVARAAGFVADLAQQLAPVDTGSLRDTIRVEPIQPALQMTVNAGGVQGGVRFVDYAAAVEYGTADSPAQPFLTPAARAVDVGKEVAAELRATIRRLRVR